MTTTAQKPWFRINAGIEYSTDFKFFSENQIRIVRTGKKHSFCSRLEAKTFKTEIALGSQGMMDDCDIVSISKQIHKEILAGQHGVGELVN
jgi:hypothetical protein